MIGHDRVVAVIPARGGSKTIPYKNIKNLLGKPLIGWTIEAAKQVPAVDRIIVSTDDDCIAKAVKPYGIEVMERPAHLAQDDSLPIDVIVDLVSRLKKAGETALYLVYLEPTSPLRQPLDISQCLDLLADKTNGFQSVATFCEANLHPYRAWKIEPDSCYEFIADVDPWLPRQKLPKAYQLNGAVYALRIDQPPQPSQPFLPKPIGGIIMPKERSIDIDDSYEFLLAEWLLRRQLGYEKS